MKKGSKEEVEATMGMHKQAQEDAKTLGTSQAQEVTAPVTNPVQETTPAPVAQAAVPAPVQGTPRMKFAKVATSRDKYQRGFYQFQAEGDTFTGRPVRMIAPNQDPDNLDNPAIEFEQYPSGLPWLLPGNMQLWEFVEGQQESGRMDRVLEITLVQIVPSKDPKDKNPAFKRFRITEEIREGEPGYEA